MPNQNSKDIQYLDRDFDGIRERLEEFAKTYFPNTYQDFSDESIGNMFIELSAYVGDVLSYYTDQQFRENFLQHAEEVENVRQIAQALGYTPRMNRPATTELEVFVVAPATTDQVTGDLKPDFSVVPVIREGMEISSISNPNVIFRTTREIDFSVDNFRRPREVEIFNTDNGGNPTSYLLKKTVSAVAGEVKTQTFDFGTPEKYKKISINDEEFIDIVEVVDSDNNNWFEVPYLAQETVFQEFKNRPLTDPNFSSNTNVRSLLKVIRTPRRFVRKIDRDGTVSLQFGSGTSSEEDREIVPSPKNIGNPILTPEQKLVEPLDPSNFLDTATYGQVPSNTTLTVSYSAGGGEESNVPKDDLEQVDTVDFAVNELDITNSQERQKVQNVQNSLGVRNPIPATGGQGPETKQEIRNNARAFFGTQDRIVTEEDYVVRALNIPERYGSIAKAFVTKDQIETRQNTEDNPLGINLYVLGFDENKNFTTVNDAVKQNLINYLKQYRMLTDAVNVKDGFIINISIDFEIYVFSTYNKRDVLAKALSIVREEFKKEKQNFNEPIIKGDIIQKINEVGGVQNVANFTVENEFGSGYSDNIYDIESATRDDIIYPSLDPSIFSVRYPDRDIKARAL